MPSWWISTTQSFELVNCPYKKKLQDVIKFKQKGIAKNQGKGYYKSLKCTQKTDLNDTQIDQYQIVLSFTR